MPQNGQQQFTAIDLEREVLGAAMLDEDATRQTVQLLEEEHFAGVKAKHPAIFEGIFRLFSEGHPVNTSTVAQHVEGVEEATLSDMTMDVASTANVEHHARIITERYLQRRGRQILTGAARAFDGHDVFDVLDGVQKRLSELIIPRSGNTHIRHAVAEALERSEEWKQGLQTGYVPTGFWSLDNIIGGYPREELTTLAAHTGAGKTSLIVQILRSLAQMEAAHRQAEKEGREIEGRQRVNGAVLMFSAEMTSEQVAARAASGMAEVNLRDLRAGRATDAKYERYDEALGALAQLEIHVDDTSAPTFPHIRARCEQVKTQSPNGLSFIAVDYDEKINSEGETEELRVSAIAKGLKGLAKRFGVPVVALSQYSRGASNNYDYPEDRHLRYSGKKEQESAVILHWHWPQYFVDKGVDPFASKHDQAEGNTQIAGYRENSPERGYLICTKNRHGPTGNAVLNFYPEHTRFEDPRFDEAPF